MITRGYPTLVMSPSRRMPCCGLEAHPVFCHCDIIPSLIGEPCLLWRGNLKIAMRLLTLQVRCRSSHFVPARGVTELMRSLTCIPWHYPPHRPDVSRECATSVAKAVLVYMCPLLLLRHWLDRRKMPDCTDELCKADCFFQGWLFDFR